MRLEDMSALFYELGCKAAYNLFGGVNALMHTDTGPVSTPHAETRPVSDILYIAEPAALP
jgi:exopolysaccharide biosynthesis protein